VTAMKKLLLQSAKIVGTATEKAWSQVHTFSPADEEKQRLRGELLAVLSLSGLGEGVEAVAAGREIIARLHEEYYGHLEEKALVQLKQAVKKVCSEGAAEAGVEIGAVAIVGNVLYAALAGEGQLVLQRDSQIGVVLQGPGQTDGSEEKLVATASGYLHHGDLFLLGTGEFFKTVAAGVLKAALAADSPEEVTEALAPAIHGRTESGTVAAVVCRVEEESEKESVGLTPLKEEVKPIQKKEKKWLRLEEKIKEVWQAFQNRLGEKAIYLRQGISHREERSPRAKKTTLTVASILVVLFVISVFLGGWQRRRLGLERKTATLFQEARQKKEEGEALLELNPARARELLLEAQSLSQQIEAEGLKTAEFEKFKAALDQALNQILKEHQVELKLFFDLELIKQAAKGDDWAVSGGKLIVLDREKPSVYEVGITDKKSAILAGGKSLAQATQIAAYLPYLFVLTDQGIVRVDKLIKKENLAIKVDEAWGEIADFQAFAGNLYLLDQKEGLWKYPAVETSTGQPAFGARRRWLKGEAPDFSQAVGMAIDGSIWVLKADGTVWKFTQGRKEAFGLAGLPGDQPLTPTAIYTDDDCQFLYLLDQAHSRVVVLAKSGEYEASYSWSSELSDGASLGEIKGLAVSEEEKKILLLAGSKIYEIQLKK